MKYEVVKRFRDKYTGELILPGDSFICDENERVENLLARGLIKKSYDSLSKKDLSELLKEKGIEHSEKQTKSELIALLGGD